jgi:hypothetical protein
LPSSIRLHAALSACGLEKSTILGTEMPAASPLQVLRFDSLSHEDSARKTRTDSR